MISYKKNRVAIYVRVSTSYQIDKDSLPMQKQDLIAYTKLILNTDDYVIYEDAGYSGKNTDRPKFQEMMSQARAGVFTHILVWKIDRISRNLIDFATMYQELKNLGVVFVSKNEQFDTSTAMGEAMLKIILVFAELERNMISERVTATMISRANNGQWNGGPVPFGYNHDSSTDTFSVNENEAAVIRLIHDKYEELKSATFLSRYLNDNGYRTRCGFLWSTFVLNNILQSIFYCGDYRYNVFTYGAKKTQNDESEWITIENHHPAIISREQKNKVLRIISENRRNFKLGEKHTNYVHIFSSIIFCANCGNLMSPSKATKLKEWKYSRYYCRNKTDNKCHAKATSDAIIGEFVINYILNMLNVQKNFKAISSPAELEKKLLIGDAFNYVEHIEPDGLNDLYNILSSGKIKGSIYGKGVNLKKKTKPISSELSKLKREKQKLERALDRLTSLFLYSDNAISETEFIIKKTEIINSIDNLNNQIGFSNIDNWQEIISDEEFVDRASEFIIAKNLSERKYISFKRLALSTEPEILKTFMLSIIDSIYVKDSLVCQIIFKNGLSHKFIFRK